MRYPNEFQQVFGNVGNSSKTVGYADADRKQPVEMRKGKTARDKANGHLAGRKNIRVWSEGSGPKGSGGEWVKR